MTISGPCEEGELLAVDGKLMDVCDVLSPYTPALGFLAAGRSKCLLRMPCDSPGEERALSRGRSPDDIASAEDSLASLLKFLASPTRCSC